MQQRVQASNVCAVCWGSLQIKPLCLHERITEPDQNTPLNHLVITGKPDLARLVMPAE
jgi:hypothetical protein